MGIADLTSHGRRRAAGRTWRCQTHPYARPIRAPATPAPPLLRLRRLNHRRAPRTLSYSIQVWGLVRADDHFHPRDGTIPARDWIGDIAVTPAQNRSVSPANTGATSPARQCDSPETRPRARRRARRARDPTWLSAPCATREDGRSGADSFLASVSASPAKTVFRGG